MSTTPVRRIEDSTSFHAAVDWKMGALVMAAAVASVWYFRLPLVFDPNAPEFNPAVFVPLLLLAYGAVHLGRGLRERAIGRRFGATTLEIEGHQLLPGDTLRGRIVTTRDLVAPSGFHLRLRCIASRRIGATSSSGSRTRDEILWQAEATAISARSSGEGIPVALAIPKRTADKAAGDPLRWTLEVEAQVDGRRFAALFGVPVVVASD